MANSDQPAAGERRSNAELRPVFEQAYTIIRPFFEEGTGWNTSLGHQTLAMHALHAAFPDLGQQQVRIMVSAAHRVYRSGGVIAQP